MADLPAQLVRTRLFTLGVPDRFTVTPDGAVLFLRSRAGDDTVACLWALDPGEETPRLLADPATLHGPHDGPGITGYAAARGLVAFALDGGLWALNLDGAGRARRLPAAENATNPGPDPRGRRIAYVRDGALRVIETDGTGDRTIAAPDGPDVTFGADGYWWAPDGERLLVTRVDSAAVERWHLADPASPATKPRAVRYAAAGMPVPEVTLWIAAPDGDRIEVRGGRNAYVVGAGWDDHGPYATVQSRDQRTVRFLGIDPADGRTTVRWEQRDARWAHLVPGLPVRTASGALVAHTDVDGTRRLTVDGTPVTPAGLQLRAVLGVDGEDVLFTASEEPTETHLWTCRARTEPTRLSAEPGVHSGVRRGGTLVHVARCADRPDGHVTVLRDGHPAVSIASRAEEPVLDVRATPLLLGPRALRAALHLPSWYRTGGERLPVLLDPYGGAARQRVTAEPDWRTLVAQWFAEQGFAVLVADGRGTPGRGPVWEREVHGDLFGPVLEDQVTALHEAARLRPELDLTRVGIRGWSFGGSLAALAVLRRPDVFHAAVAGAGVTDQRLYHAQWRERFLGHPDDFPGRYEESSLVRAAPRLTRPLLLIHGLADANVHPANTLRLSAALLAAGRAHEVLLLPGVGHQAMGSAVAADLLRHQLRFLRRHLGASPDPAARPPG